MVRKCTARRASPHRRTFAPTRMQKECPMCGDLMQLRTHEAITRVPGSPQEVRTVVKEWVCRECDYFEDAEDDV